MPVLKKPQSIIQIDLPPRRGRLIAETDVLVVGGGPAGMGAAVGAADAGANVILVEQHGFLGGNATAALVTYFMSFYTPFQEQKIPELHLLYPQDQGPSEPVIGGVVTRFINTLVEHGGAVPPSKETGYIVSFDPEVFKNTAADFLDEAGVTFLYHAFASGILEDHKVKGVILETKSGPLVIKAGVVIDCTGDGDIAALAGAPFEIGRPEDGLSQPMTLMFRITGFNRAKFAEYVKNNPDQWRGGQGLTTLIANATAKHQLDLPRDDILFFGSPHREEIVVNSTRINRVSGIDIWDLTLAEYVGRQQVRRVAEFLKEYVPGFENSYVIQTGNQVGVRETRRITGRYILTADDILNVRKFEDVIARGSYPIDIHDPRGKGTTLKRLPVHEAYDIPLRCLIPLNVDNLLVAGRCISGTHEALASYRIMPISMAVGQAAGVCAALAVRGGQLPAEVDHRSVQQELLRQGANLGHIK